MYLFLLKRMALAAPVFLITLSSSANETINHPVQLQSIYQPDANSNALCLQAEGNDGEVVLGPCGKPAKPNALFTIVKTDNQYYTIHPVNNSGQCLRTFAGSQQVKLDRCVENNDTPENYLSMSYWALTKIDDFYNLENKYKSDIGSLFSCFSVLKDGVSVGVGECTISGSSAKYNNMRRWRLIY